MSLTLTPDELRELTGYSRAAEQLAELLRRGYSRAHRNRLGDVVLTVAHFNAVEQGQPQPARPRVRKRQGVEA